jgi:hypothetical protein
LSKLQKNYKDLEALLHAIDIAMPEACELNKIHASWAPTADNVAEINILIWDKLKVSVENLLNGRQDTRPEFTERQTLSHNEDEGQAIERNQIHEDIYMNSWGR